MCRGKKINRRQGAEGQRTHHGLEDVVRAALRGLRAARRRRAVVGARAVGRARRLGRGRQRPAGTGGGVSDSFMRQYVLTWQLLWTKTGHLFFVVNLQVYLFIMACIDGNTWAARIAPIATVIRASSWSIYALFDVQPHAEDKERKKMFAFCVPGLPLGTPEQPNKKHESFSKRGTWSRQLYHIIPNHSLLLIFSCLLYRPVGYYSYPRTLSVTQIN